jgi:hypothetical protein
MVICVPLLTLELLAGLVIATTGDALAVTEIVIGDEVVTPLSLSVALTVIVCDPPAAFDHAKLYGAVRSSPSFVVPLKNSTFLIDPSASVAVAEMVICVPLLTLELLAGVVMETAGSVLDVTSIVIADDVVTAFSLSVALAVIV